MKKEEKTVSKEETKEIKAAKKSAAAKKSTKTKTAAKSSEADVTEVVEAKTDTKSEVKKTAAKKPSTKKTKIEADPMVNAIVEYEGRSILIKNIVSKAVKAYKKANKGVVIKKVDVYIKPEENAAYYVINGDSSPSYKVEL